MSPISDVHSGAYTWRTPSPAEVTTLAGHSEDHERLDQALTYASDVGVLGVLRALTRLRGLILLPIIGRGLGAASYGAWTQSLVAVSVGMSLILLQLDVAVVRFVSGTSDRDRRREIFFPALVLVSVLGLAMTISTMAFPGTLASYVLGDPSYLPMARWIGIWTALTAVAQLGQQLQRGLHRVKLFGALNTIETLGQLLIVTVLILFNGQLLVAVQGAVVWELVFAVGVLVLAVRDLGLGWPRLASLIPSLRFSLPLVPSYYAGTVLSFADRLVVAAQLGSEAVGIYAAVYSLARIVRELFVPVTTALLPTVSRAWDRGDRPRGRRLLAHTLRYSLALAFPALAGLSVLGSPILNLLAARGVSQGALPLIPLIGLGYLFSGIQSIFVILLQIVQDTKALAVSRGIAALAYMPLVLVGVTYAGLLGGACATLIGYALDMGLAIRFTFRREKISFPVLDTFKAVLSSVVMAGVVSFLPHAGLGRLILAVASGVFCFVLLMTLLGAFGRAEFRFLGSLLWRGSENGGPAESG